MPGGSPTGGHDEEHRSLRSEITPFISWIAPTEPRSGSIKTVSSTSHEERSSTRRAKRSKSTSRTGVTATTRSDQTSIPSVGTSSFANSEPGQQAGTETEQENTTATDAAEAELHSTCAEESQDSSPVDEHPDFEALEWNSSALSTRDEGEHELLPALSESLPGNWKDVRKLLPEDWQWDIEYDNFYADDGSQHGCWTCTPFEADAPEDYPLTIARSPVVVPVEYRWPPISGLIPPPDPRPAAPIDCRAPIALELARDIFLTFYGSIGFYVLIDGLLQVVVPAHFDTAWASLHFPHKYGGLKVCYIERTFEPTMQSGPTKTARPKIPYTTPGYSASSLLRPARSSALSVQSVASSQSLKLNDSIEARPLANYQRAKHSGRIGIQVVKDGTPFLVMPTHVITEAIMAKSMRDYVSGRSQSDRAQKLRRDWNKYADIWAGNGKIGTIHKSFDEEADIYPNGFNHDITLIKPTSSTAVKGVASPLADLGWLNHDSWAALRRQTTKVNILADTKGTRSAKSIQGSRPSDVLVVGEGIFLNQKAAAGDSTSLKEHDISTWKDLVSRALLYRVYPDFDPPQGYSGLALHAEGVRQDGTVGQGIVGFQSFVQRSGHVQNFEMEGPALERRLQVGRVAFYGAFEVPAELKTYDIV